MPMKKHNENVENLLCIGVDGRTKTHYTTRNQWRKNGSKILKKAKGPECHLTITKETPNESIYLTHRVLPDIGATGTLLRLSLLTTRIQIQAVKVDLLHF